MIEVIIKSVIPFSEYNNVVYSYKVTCLLNSGKEIEVIDEKPFNLTALINQRVNIEIGSHFLSQNNNCYFVIEGKILKQQNNNCFYFSNNEILITISKETIIHSKVQIDEIGKFYFEELYLKNVINSL